MSKHLKLHSFTGTSDHDFTGLVSGQIISYNGTSISSSDSVTSFSASTLSGGTILSGSTDLYNIFLTSASDDVTRVSGGTNINTGGTANLPVINLDNDIVLTSVNATTLSGGTIYSGSTDIYDIFSTTGGNLWSASTGVGSIIANNGSGNTASGQNALAGGIESTASGNYASFSFGYKNTSSDYGAATLGGYNNLASGSYAAVLGGGGNTSSAYGSSIIGGDGNRASANGSSIAGGSRNFTSGNFSFIGGGSLNSATTVDSSVVGGKNNIVTGNDSIIAGGNGNSVSGLEAGTLAGRGNLVSGTASSILGGTLNIAGGKQTSIVGGKSNSATTVDSVVVGGSFNIVSQEQSAIVGGNSNVVSGYYSIVLGGQNNTASGDHSSTLAGKNNTASGLRSVVVGGSNLTNNINDNVMVPHLTVDGNLSAGTGGSVIYSAGTDLYNIFATSGSGVQGTGTANTIAMWNGTSTITDSILTFDGTSGVTVAGDIFVEGNVEVLGTATTINTQDLFVADNTITLNSGGTATSATGGGIFIEDGVTNGIDASWTIDSNGNWTTSSGISSSAMTVSNGNLNVTGGGVMMSGGTDIYDIFSSTSANLWSASTGVNSIIANNGGSNLASGTQSFVIGNNNTASGFKSIVLGGNGSTASGNFSSVINGDSNIASANYSSTLGGFGNTASGLYSATIGGYNTSVSGIYSVVIGGYGLTNNVPSNVMVPHLTVDGNLSAGTGGNVIYSAGTDLYSIFLTSSDITRVSGGTNISTGGTANNPTINLEADIILTSVNTTTLSGGTIYSGSTDISDLFAPATGGGYLTGSGTDNTVPLWNGTTGLDDSILSQSGTVMTAAGDMVVTGNFDVLGTTTTINTQTLQAADNNIELNYSGNSTSATGGGMTVLSGISNSVDATWQIDATGNWAANAGIQGTTVTATDFFSMVPKTGAVTAADNDAWFHSGATGSITLNYKVGGVEYAVELA